MRPCTKSFARCETRRWRSRDPPSLTAKLAMKQSSSRKKKSGKSPRRAVHKPVSVSVADALLDWLTAPGNYARWQEGPPSAFLPEIREKLEATSYPHRKPSIMYYTVPEKV